MNSAKAPFAGEARKGPFISHWCAPREWICDNGPRPSPLGGGGAAFSTWGQLNLSVALPLALAQPMTLNRDEFELQHCAVCGKWLELDAANRSSDPASQPPDGTYMVPASFEDLA